MEVILGFAVGYWIGVRNGPDGMRKAIDSARAVWASPESRRLLAEGLSTLETVAPAIERMQKNRGGLRAAVVKNVVADIIERRQEQRATAA